MLNGKRVNIPSIRVKAGDEITLRAKSAKSPYFKNFDDLVAIVDQPTLGWMKANKKSFSIKITGEPTREEVEPDINEQLIVEYYSR